MKNRDLYFDFLRGIAIIFVVGIHTSCGADFENVFGYVAVTIRNILNCAVPIFLAISGFFLARKKFNSRKDHLSFFFRQSKKIYIPTLLWSLPWMALSLYNGSDALLTIVVTVFCGMSVYYFIALIIQYYALLPVYQKLNRGGVIGSAIISLICVSFVVFIMQINGIKLPLLIYAGPFPLWSVFFAIGCYLGNRECNYGVKWLFMMAVGALVLSLLESKYLYAFHGGGLGIKPSSFLWSALIILILFSRNIRKRFVINRFTTLIILVGELSFGIYLTHMYFVRVVCPVLPELWIVRWIIVLFLDFGGVYVARKIFHRRLLAYAGIW